MALADGKTRAEIDKIRAETRKLRAEAIAAEIGAVPDFSSLVAPAGGLTAESPSLVASLLALDQVEAVTDKIAQAIDNYVDPANLVIIGRTPTAGALLRHSRAVETTLDEWAKLLTAVEKALGGEAPDEFKGLALSAGTAIGAISGLIGSALTFFRSENTVRTGVVDVPSAMLVSELLGSLRQRKLDAITLPDVPSDVMTDRLAAVRAAYQAAVTTSLSSQWAKEDPRWGLVTDLLEAAGDYLAALDAPDPTGVTPLQLAAAGHMISSEEGRKVFHLFADIAYAGAESHFEERAGADRILDIGAVTVTYLLSGPGGKVLISETRRSHKALNRRVGEDFHLET